MDYNEQQYFEAMCDTAELYIQSYNQHRFVPNWVFQRFHHRGKQVARLVSAIQSLKTSVSSRRTLPEATEELVKILLNKYYFLYVRTVSHRLRELVLDALFAVLNFTSNDVSVYQELVVQKADQAAYFRHFEDNQKLQSYKDYFANKHAIYGMPANVYGQSEIALAAKEGLVNGELIDHFGVKKFIDRGLIHVKHELEALSKDKVEKGFLTLASIEGYIHKLDMLLAECHDPHANLTDLVQNSRYVLETIINTAGIMPLGPAKFSEHAVLITCCYWVDEFLLQAKGVLEAG